MQLEERDYFTDHAVLLDPYEYFASLYAKDPLYLSKGRNVLYITGFKEALEVLNNTEDFSSVIAPGGAGMPLPFEAQGDDISEQLEQNRHKFPGSDLVVAYDGAPHAASRSLLARLFTPSRLKANEDYMREVARSMVQEVVAKGQCDLINEVATPFVTLVIADILGVPADDREHFKQVIAAGPPAGNMDAEERPHTSATLEYLSRYFVNYIAERRANPRADVLTELATAKFPDGSTPDLGEVVRLSMFLFAAGQDTSAKLLGNCMRFLVEDKALQQHVRANLELVPAFIEEVLRLEGSTKATFRVARRKTQIAGREIPAGQRIVIALAAANRDPRRWPEPNSFKLERERIKEHLAFGRGAHTCIGAPLARAEVRVILEEFLGQTSDISLSDAEHGPPGKRDLRYEPSFIIRGLEKLIIEVKGR